MILDKNFIREEGKLRKSGGINYIFIYKCANDFCTNELKYRNDQLKIKSGFCLSCQNRKEPFRSTYNGLFNSRTLKERGIKVEITFEEFLEFMKITECHYCNEKIIREPYGIKNGKYTTRAYYLDRKDPKIGYVNTNLVVCCTRCNIGKSNKYSYEEWYGMTKYFRDKNEDCPEGVCGL